MAGMNGGGKAATYLGFCKFCVRMVHVSPKKPLPSKHILSDSNSESTRLKARTQFGGGSISALLKPAKHEAQKGFLSELAQEQLRLIKTCEAEAEQASQLCKEAGKILQKHGRKRLPHLLRWHLRSGQVSEALAIYKTMKKNHTHSFTNALITALVEDGQVESALEIFNEIAIKDLKPDCHTYRILMNGLVKKQKVNDGFMLFQKFIECGITVNARSCEKLFSKAWSTNHAYTALELLKGKAKGKAYEMLIETVRKFGHLQEARNLFMKMGEDGYKYSKKVYSVMIRYLCEADEVEEAWALMKEMVQQSHQPLEVSCNMIISGLFKKGRLNDALDMFAELKQKGPAPNAPIYNTLISRLAAAEKPDLALEILCEMKQLNYKPDVTLYFVLIGSFSKLGNMKQAQKLSRKLKLQGLALG